MTDPSVPRPRTSLGTRILTGLGLGLATGLLVGEYAAPLKVAGDIFIGLLQMTVLPYIIVALIANVGRLSLDFGRSLIGRAAVVWLGLLFVGGAMMVAMSLAFPDRSSPSFFSAALLEKPRSFDFVQLFIPVNVFRSLVNNAVPGVVFFCISVGVALMSLPEKESVIRGLDALGEVIARVNGFVVRMMPYGVFAIAAAAAGTMTLEEFGRLRGYLLVFTASSFILAFWVLPAIVAACTPFSHREVLRASRDAMLTAFATGKVLVVLPMLVENTRRMFEERQMMREDVGASVDVLFPLIYPFPYLGKLIALLFVPFAAAFVGRSLELIDYPNLMVLGTISLFGGPILAIPMLLEAHELPSDMFQLFVVSGVLTSRLGDLVGVINLVAFTVLTTCALTGSAAIRWHRLAVALAIGAVLVVVSSVGSRVWLESMKNDYERGKVIAGMHIMDAQVVVDYSELALPRPNPTPLRPDQSRLQRIRERGILRVGVNEDNLPYAFRNGQGDLVGMDIELAHRLAHDLGVALEFVPFERASLAEQIAADHFDIAMSGLVGTIERSEHMRLSRPYLDATFSLVVPDHRARHLDTFEELVAVDSLHVGILTESQFSRALREFVPHADTQIVESTRWFFEGDHDLDALIISAEAGAAWSMLYPGYQVVIPTRRHVSMPMVYALPPRDPEFAAFVDFWISLQQGMGTVDNLYAYWVRGEGTAMPEPRWSVARDVLGWID